MSCIVNTLSNNLGKILQKKVFIGNNLLIHNFFNKVNAAGLRKFKQS